MAHWQVQEVKQHLSKVIRLARTDGPQMITYRGEPRAWIISDEEYIQLTKPKESIVDFFQRSPHREVELQIKRRKDLSRNIEL